MHHSLRHVYGARNVVRVKFTEAAPTKDELECFFADFAYSGHTFAVTKYAFLIIWILQSSLSCLHGASETASVNSTAAQLTALKNCASLVDFVIFDH